MNLYDEAAGFTSQQARAGARHDKKTKIKITI